MALGALLGSPGPLGRLLGSLGALLGRSWGAPGSSWGRLGPLLGFPGPFLMLIWHPFRELPRGWQILNFRSGVSILFFFRNGTIPKKTRNESHF